MSSRKEARFFSTDIHTGTRARTWAEYEALWAHAKPGALRGEATPDYIQSQVAVEALLAARPDARLIAMVRNPVEIVAAHHAQMHVDGHEDLADLETAWRVQDSRLCGEALPRNCAVSAAKFHYRSYAAIGDQLERFLAVVPADQRIVIVYDDFKTDTRREYLRALDLLGLADDGRSEFLPENQRRALRWAGLARGQSWLNRNAPLLYGPAKRVANALGISPASLLRRANVRAAGRNRLRAEFASELIADFLPQIEKVERALDRDLSRWKTPAIG